ncbi:MAG: alpha/beta hydrolase [Dermatophilaceae bacterium]
MDSDTDVPGSAVEGESVLFRMPDPHGELAQVRLSYHLDLGPQPVTLERVGPGWQLRWPVPSVGRIEYEFLVSRRGGGDEPPAYQLDPGNPVRAPGPFGAKSVLELPGYRPPAWLHGEPVRHHRVHVTLVDTPVGTVDALVWSPADTEAGRALPVLVAHDGPELDRYAGLTHFVGVMVNERRLPPMRVVLLAPGPRNLRYAASPEYAEALTGHVLPRLLAQRPTDRPPVLMGPSLGAVAALHAEWTHPGTFGGLFLQSGSFFTAATDPQERGFEYWKQVSRFVRAVHTGAATASTPAVGITVGTAEENHTNNLLLAGRLRTLGLPVAVGEVADGHTFTCWRDAFDPHLLELLTKVWC